MWKIPVRLSACLTIRVLRLACAGCCCCFPYWPSVAVLVALVKLGRRISATTVALALILGGAVGNAWDRLRFGYVIDFLEVHIIHYHWPDFNVADSAIVVGGILLFFDALFMGKEEGPVSEPAIRNHHG